MKLNLTRQAIFLLMLMPVACLQGQTTSSHSTRSLRPSDAHGKSNASRNIYVAPDVDHVFPYILASPSWTTTFYLTNLEDREINVTCEFVAANGNEQPFRFSFDPEGETTAFTASRISKYSTESFSIITPRPAEGTTAPLITAWAYCAAETRTDRFSGYAIVRNTAANGASRDFVTALQPDSEPVFSIPFLDAAANTTGLVLLNNDLENDALLALWVFDRDGNTVANTTLTIKPSNLRVIVLNDAFPQVKSGTIRVVALEEGTKYLSAVALRSNAAGYAALPPLSPK
jgi:hypothetical protein